MGPWSPPWLCLAPRRQSPADQLPNAAQEAHARALFKEIRCVVCQNESIDDSDAEVAGNLRQAVRAQVADGRTDPQIKAYLVQRYGEFILLRPRLFSPGNAALWLALFLVVLIGWRRWCFVPAGRPRWPRHLRPNPTEEEQRRVDALREV